VLVKEQWFGTDIRSKPLTNTKKSQTETKRTLRP